MCKIVLTSSKTPHRRASSQTKFKITKSPKTRRKWYWIGRIMWISTTSVVVVKQLKRIPRSTGIFNAFRPVRQYRAISGTRRTPYSHRWLYLASDHRRSRHRRIWWLMSRMHHWTARRLLWLMYDRTSRHRWAWNHWTSGRHRTSWLTVHRMRRHYLRLANMRTWRHRTTWRLIMLRYPLLSLQKMLQFGVWI